MIKKIISLVALVLCFSMCVPIFGASSSRIVFSKNKQETKKIALTFDDGPHPRYTDKILSILEKYNIKATFFVIGVNVENYPEPLKRIYEAGHEIGNHSYSHISEKSLTGDSALEEVNKCEELIYKSIGIKPRLFRPPQGMFSEDIEKIVFEKNYSIVLWSVDTRDWAHNSVENIMKTVQSELRGGDVILMHDYTSGKNTTCDALESIIPSLIEKGYEFVTVSELMNAS